MREIKFRAWVKNNSIQEMHYADEIQINSADAKSFQLRVGFEDAFPEKNNIEQWQKDIVWMQFTGLKDKNGVDIYEGDILSNQVAKWLVVFNRGCFCHQMVGRPNGITELALRALVGGEIIGNIYENPELSK